MKQWDELLSRTRWPKITQEVEAYKEAFLALYDAPEDARAVKAEKDAWKKLIASLRSADILGTHQKLKKHWQQEALAARGAKEVDAADACGDVKTNWRLRANRQSEEPATVENPLQQTMSSWLR